MNGWDVLTWTALLILAVGSVVVFVLFLRDVWRIWKN
jgi:hypothetical protein